MIRQLFLFAIVFSALQLAWQASASSNYSRRFIEEAVAAPAAFLINRISPDVHAYAEGSHVRSRTGGLNIINGCDGMELLFLLIAGFAVVPLRWRSRLCGVIVGTLLVQLLNQARIVALFYSSRANPSLFDALHGFVAPIVMVIVIIMYFYVWLPHRSPAGAILK